MATKPGKKEGQSFPCELLRHHRSQLCDILSTAEQTMLSFTIKLYEKHVITMDTKNDVCRRKGLDGPNILLDQLETKVGQNSKHFDTILEIMKELQDLHDVLESIEKEDNERKQLETHSNVTEMSNDVQENAISEAKNLQQEFLDLLKTVYESLGDVDSGLLKLHINCFLTLEVCDEQAIREHSDKLELVLTSKGILNFLISRRFLGYLNYELLKVFSELAGNDVINHKIELYEQHHNAFISEVSFSNFIHIFTRDHASPIGLPNLKIRLSKPWEGKSVYEWKELIERRFNHWPPYLMIESVSRNCVILIYGVLPFFIPFVASDIANDEVITELNNKGVTLEPSSELVELGKGECFFQLDDILSKSSSGLAILILRRHFCNLYHSLHNPTSVANTLCFEGVLDEQSCDKIGLEDMNISDRKQVLFRELREEVRISHEKFWVFGSVLMKYKSTVALAQTFINEYNKYYIEPLASNVQSDMQGPTKYRLSFHTESEQLNKLFHDVQKISTAKSISLDDLVSFLSASFPEFENELKGCKSMSEVFSVVRIYTSLDNLSYLVAIMYNFELQESSDMLEDYHKSINQFYKKTLVSESYEYTFMDHFTRYQLKEERITVEVKEDKNYAVMDILHLLNNIFQKMSSHIKLMKLTHDNDKLIILCYAPPHLITILTRTVKENEVLLMEENVLFVNTGGFVVFEKDLEQYIVKLETENQGLEDKFGDLKDSALQKQITMMKSQLEEYKQTDIELTKELQATTIQRDTTRQLVDEKQKEIDKLKEKVDSLTSEMTDTEALSQLKKEKTELEEIESDLKHSLETQRSINKQKEIELAMYKSEVLKYEKDITEISQELETLNNLYITTKKSLDEKELKLKEIMKESHSLTSQLMEKEAKLAQLTEEKLHLEERDDVVVIDETVFEVAGDKQCTLDWPEYGLQIDAPKGSLSPEHTVELKVKVIVAGNFVLPPDCHLVSSIYWISCPERFKEKVTLNITHAAIIESQEEASYFRFYAAKCSSGPPYEFRELKNGSFMPFTESASIKLSQFSLMAAGSCISTRQRYYSQVFYKLKTLYSEWDMLFVIVKDDPAFRKFIEDKYRDYFGGVDQIVRLKKDVNSIKLKPNRDCLDQWKMTEMIASEINVEDIDYFTPKRTLHVPHCHFNFCWKSGLPVNPLNMKVDLEGADRPADFFRVILPQEVSQGAVRGEEARGSTSSPHNIVKSHLPKIIEATTDPDRLANDMSAVDLISGSVKDKVLTSPGLSNYDKASALLKEFLHYLKVYNEAQTLESFCTVLTQQDNPALKRISEEMSAAFSTYM